MKKNLLIIPSLCTILAHAMETNSFSIMHYGTIINLTKQSLSTVVNNVDLVIVGKYEQQLLQFSPPDFSYTPGKMYYADNTIYTKNKEYDSDSDDDTYKPFTEENRTLLRKGSEQKITSNIVIQIVEPRISQINWYRDPRTNQPTPSPHYAVTRPDKNDPFWSNNLTFDGVQAIIAASKDLALCYITALTDGLYQLSDKKDKSIALATLSADVGFPREKAAPIAVREVLTFVRNNPQAYARIELFVKKRSEFTLYKKLLNAYWERICPLYCAHKDQDNLLSNVPRDIIDYVTWLMMNR